jgi:hypothetical protein
MINPRFLVTALSGNWRHHGVPEGSRIGAAMARRIPQWRSRKLQAD